MKQYPNGHHPSPVGRAVEFLSCSFETLVRELADSATPDSEAVAEHKTDATHFDLIIVGSGYGGAIAAAEFAGLHDQTAQKKLRICVLERGAERLPGSFPDSLSQMPNELRVYSEEAKSIWGNRRGLFDIRVCRGYSVLVANGLGGGSLINAGVMIQPEKQVFSHDQWPTSLRNDTELDSYFEESRSLVGVSASAADDSKLAGGQNPLIDITMSDQLPLKFKALAALGGSSCSAQAVPITVKLNDSIPNQTIATNTCVQCGDCFTGCNYNAKRSLDTNLLATAAINNTRIFCGATVLNFDKLKSGVWELRVNYTDATQHKHLVEPVRIRCHKLIIAAGTLGSTELLLRSQRDSMYGLRFSKALGKRFSGNGDMLATISERGVSSNSVANENTAAEERHIGPTITGMLDFRNTDTKVLIQELAVPGVLRRMLIQSTAFSQTIDAIAQPAKSKITYSEDFCTLSPLGPVGPGDSRDFSRYNATRDPETDRLSIVALIGDDGMSAELSLPTSSVGEDPSQQGYLDIHPPTPLQTETGIAGGSALKPTKSYYERNMQLLAKLLGENDPRAWLHANPVWKPLGLTLERFFDLKIPGRQITVHPLGGCVMGDSVANAVVDDRGQVFDPESACSDGIHSGLVVLDGSVIPCALGANPALTITALALRATRLLKRQWNWAALDQPEKLIGQPRPATRAINSHLGRNPHPTQVELVERLTGDVTLQTQQGPLACVVELRLRSSNFNIAELSRFVSRTIALLDKPAPDADCRLPDRSYIRIFARQDWDRLHNIRSVLDQREHNRDGWTSLKRQVVDNYEQTLDQAALLIAPLSGHIRLLEEQPRHILLRRIDGLYAWLLNRGIRDVLQLAFGKSNAKGGSSLKSIMRYFSSNALAAFANAGRERRLGYHLVIGRGTARGALADLDFSRRYINGVKTFKYQRRSNPWRQLMDIRLSHFPHTFRGHPHSLTVDPAYFARTQVPLLHIVDEENAVDGTADVLDFYVHMARVFILHHLWALRKPDTRPRKQSTHTQHEHKSNSRLPPSLQGLSPTVHTLTIKHTLGSRVNSETFCAVLSHYRAENPSKVYPPVLCIHGYSASGSTFAHPSLYGGPGKTGGLTRFLCDQGRDIWILDMRSSAALASARQPWDFEHLAYNDIPLAIARVLQETGAPKLDIVAHCMGAVMLSMTILGDPRSGDATEEMKAVPDSINRIVLSQAGPFLQFTPINTMRAWVLGFVKELLPEDGYEFNPQSGQKEWNVLLDRLLNTLPYPDNSEHDLENPTWGYTYWQAIRRRMDALYGKTFSLANMSPDILDNIDDFFGPFSFRTLEQTLSIAKRRQLSSRYSNDFHITNDTLKSRWNFPTLWIHGEDNGLIDPISPSLTALRFDESQCTDLAIRIIPGTGHQDCLMSSDCALSFTSILEHLCDDELEITVEKSRHNHWQETIAHPRFLERMEPNNTERGIVIHADDPAFSQLRRLALVPLDSNDQLPANSEQVELLDYQHKAYFPLARNSLASPSVALLMVGPEQSHVDDMHAIQAWLLRARELLPPDLQILR